MQELEIKMKAIGRYLWKKLRKMAKKVDCQ